MKRVLFAVLFATLLPVISVFAFNGMRKGFVLGAGLGYAVHAKRTAYTPQLGLSTDSGKDVTGIGFNLIVGYAWDQFNMIVYESNVTSHEFHDDEMWAQGFNGVSWYHYFGPRGRSFFTTAGIGLYEWATPLWYSNPGVGYLVGGGYEFMRHAQVGVYISGGKTHRGSSSATHSHVNLLVSAIAF